MPHDPRKYIDESIKVTKTTIEFGPLKIYRVPAVPSNDFGRNGDLAIIDDTTIPMTEIATNVTPVVTDLCQKVGGVWVCGLGGGGIGGPAFGQFTTDAGVVTATTPTENLDVIGGPGISTSIVAGDLVVNNTANIFDSVAVPTQGPISASGLTDTLNIVAGTNMSITTNPGTNTVTFSSAGGVGIPGLSVIDINGQPTLVLEDTTRAGKRLSIAEHTVMFSESKLFDKDFLDVGDATDEDTGYIAEFDGTVVYASGHCENGGGATKCMKIYINHVDSGVVLGTLGPGANTDFVNTTLNLNFMRGDHLSLRAVDDVVPMPGPIEDTVVVMTLKWTG